eukprot:15439883-Alexandrium_andersonii.AAC.1
MPAHKGPETAADSLGARPCHLRRGGGQMFDAPCRPLGPESTLQPAILGALPDHVMQIGNWGTALA